MTDIVRNHLEKKFTNTFKMSKERLNWLSRSAVLDQCVSLDQFKRLVLMCSHLPL